MVGIVVQPGGIAGDHGLEKPFDVGQQRGLKLVDEEGAGRVHRPETDQALADLEAADKFHDPAGDVDQLDPLIGLDHQRFAVNRQAPNCR